MSRGTPTYLVLGGGGFIGVNLCKRLLADGFRVRAFGRRCLFPNEIEGAEWYQGDFRDIAALSAAVQNSDIVIHLVHSTTPQTANYDMAEDVQQNVVPSLALMEICRRAGVGRLVFVSSGGTVYGRLRQIPIAEDSPTDPLTAYGISKLSIEKYLALYEHLYGLDYRVLRLANPFGPFQTPVKNQGVVAAFVARGMRNETIEIWGDGSVVRDFIYIDDVVDALVAASVDPGSARIFNIGSGVGHSLRDIVAAIERQLGRRLAIKSTAGRALDVPVSVLAIDRAKEHLQWTPKTGFEEGLKRTINWWATTTIGHA